VKRKIKALICALALILPVVSLTACKGASDNTLVLRVANCEEYIDLGDWDEDEVISLPDEEDIFGEDSMISDFEEWYEDTYGIKVKVEYSTYGTNEELYNQMSLGNTFDLVCPSEYMIMKLMEEGRLEPYSQDFFDESDENNYYIKGVSPYIRDVFDSLEEGGESVRDYAAGYMWGTMGIVYEPTELSEEDVSHWSILLDKDHARRITMKDAVRDSYFVGLSILRARQSATGSPASDVKSEKELSDLLNDTSQETVDQVEEILSDMRLNAYSLETDSGKADMVSGKVIANMQWSGDAVYTMDQADEDDVRLCYSVPEECSNLWFDGCSMLKKGLSEDSGKKHAAQAFVNFISRPDNVIRNMYYIGYTSAISGGDDQRIFQYLEDCYGAEDGDESAEYDLSYFFGGDDAAGEYVLDADPDQLTRQLYAAYPTREVLSRCSVMKPFDPDANRRISQMWINVRCVDIFTKH
jgi:spermidine/putrescine transport system substrate-binding protein